MSICIITSDMNRRQRIDQSLDQAIKQSLDQAIKQPVEQRIQQTSTICRICEIPLDLLCIICSVLDMSSRSEFVTTCKRVRRASVLPHSWPETIVFSTKVSVPAQILATISPH